MLEGPRTYPLLRGRRRRGRRLHAPRRSLRIAAILLATLAVVAGVALLARHATRPDTRAELALALGAFEHGNYSAAREHARVATTGPETAIANAVLARIHLALGDGIAAEGALNQALAAGLAPRRLHQLFAEAYLLQGDPDRALATLKSVDPRYAAYGTRISARALATKGDVPGATRRLQVLLARSPGNGDGWADLGRIRLDAGDIGGADEAAQRALAIDPRRPERLVLRGEVVRSRFGLNAALPWFTRALTRDAYFHPALIAQAATLGDLGRYRAMLEGTRRALAARPGSPQALYLQAVLAARAGRFDLARAMLGRIGDAGVDVPGVALLWGTTAYAAGDYQQAVANLRALVGRQPMNLVARRLLGAALLRAGDAKGALEVLRPLALRPDADSYTLILVGRAFEATGERDWAARFLDRAARAANAPPRAFGTDAGVAVLANAAADAPGDPVAAVAYVRGLVAAGDLAAATARAQALAAVSPGSPDAHLLAGDALAAAGRFGPAYAAYARVADLRFDLPALLRLAEAADRSGQRRAGANALALYLSQNPESIVARRALANLQLDARDWSAAIDTLEGLRSAIGDGDAVLLAQLAYAHAGAGDAATAVRSARAAYALAPLDAVVCDAYARVLFAAGDRAGSAQLLRKAAALSRP